MLCLYPEESANPPVLPAFLFTEWRHEGERMDGTFTLITQTVEKTRENALYKATGVRSQRNES